jgi:D-arabinose 1-dehydrogenase-like Zn-dependent alcohol dehydrogenase
MLIPAPEKLSASAIALIEPWGCVENAYASDETQRIEPDNTMLIVADVIVTPNDLTELFKQWGQPAKVIWASQYRPPEVPGVNMELCPEIARLTDSRFDDVIYLGANPNRVEALFSKVGPQGLFNIVLCGERFGREIAVPIGRIHYAGIRITGTVGYAPADSMKHIPQSSEVRKGDKINIVGAAGPMGTMHVIRNIYRGIEGVSISAGDSDDGRLAILLKTAEPMAAAKNVPYKQYSPVKDKMPEGTDYAVIMAPAPELAAAAVLSAGKRAIINIFAGIPDTMTAKINLDAYIEKQMYFVGTSGSVLEDMKRELAKLESGVLDTNISVAAVCGLDGVLDGIRAIENRSIAGKIIAYPVCKGLPLTMIAKMTEKLPEVAACLSNGIWTAQAEQKLLERYASPVSNG